MSKEYYVYILTNGTHSTFYVGVTNNLYRRVLEHKNKTIEGFTAKYNTSKLVYFEQSNSIEDALNREKQLKNWHRDWKINLIKTLNPEFKDLCNDIGLS